MSVYRFIAAEKASLPITFMCRWLGVSSRGFYAWRARPAAARAPADAALTVQITAIHAASRGIYGAPRVHAELADAHSIRCGRWRRQGEARMAVFDYIEAFYHPRRRHSALGDLSPQEYERRYQTTAA